MFVSAAILMLRKGKSGSAGKLSRLSWKASLGGALDPLQIRGSRDSRTTHQISQKAVEKSAAFCRSYCEDHT